MSLALARKIHVVTLLFVMSLLLVFALLGTSEASEQSPLRLSLERAIELAIAESETVMQSANDITKSGYRRSEAISAALPHLNADVGYNYYPKVQTIDMVMPGPGPISVELKDDFDMMTSVTLEQPIYTFGKIHNAIRASTIAREISRFSKEAVEREVSYETAKAYITVLLAQEALKIARESYNNAESTRAILDERFAMGRVPKSDGIKAQADVAARVPVLKESESDLDLAMRHLKRLVGAHESQHVVLTDALARRFPRYDADAALADMFEIEPRLKLLDRSIDFNAAIAKKEKAQYFPTIGAFANYTLFGQSDNAWIGSEKLQNLGTIGLNIRVPIWNGNKTWAVYQQALIDKANAELSLRRANKDLELELRNAISEYDSMLATYKANREAVRLSRESFQAQQDSFRSGGKTLTDLNDAEMQLTRNRLNEAVTLYKINNSIASIERLISGEGEKSWKNRVAQ
ncbi:MAG: Cobalt-zinc-cadmium resistance protein CzcC precursor [bacterium ADurb.Bin270]|nr:MAG: Cobalt-zinc-cadmium resistance protein CzcC precursor [bacterium ADurb.Bin270]